MGTRNVRFGKKFDTENRGTVKKFDSKFSQMANFLTPKIVQHTSKKKIKEQHLLEKDRISFQKKTAYAVLFSAH